MLHVMHDHHLHSHHLHHSHAPNPGRHGQTPENSLRTQRALAWALVLTATFMVAEMFGGLLARSLALIADAGHMLTDAAALAVSLAAAYLATRPADTHRTFGYRRVQVLAAFVNGCALFAIVGWIVYEAFQRLWTPLSVDAPLMLWIGVTGAAVNVLVFATLRRADPHNINVASAILHVLGDLLGSVAAVIAALIVIYTGWVQADPLLSLGVSALIVRSAWRLVRRSAHILMEGAPDWLDVGDLRRTLESHIPVVRDVHHVHCWSIGPQETLLTMHVVVDNAADSASVLQRAQAILAERYGISHATIQIEQMGCPPECVDARA